MGHLDGFIVTVTTAVIDFNPRLVEPIKQHCGVDSSAACSSARGCIPRRCAGQPHALAHFSAVLARGAGRRVTVLRI